MFTALVLASLGQFMVIVTQPEPVVYELPVVQAQTMTYQYSFGPVFQAAPTVTYSLPATYYLRSDPLLSVYPPFMGGPFMGGRTVIRERGPGFRSRMVLRY